MQQSVLLAVNGTLMRGLALEQNMLNAGAHFVKEARTEPRYRLWSIRDEHPAMVRVNEGEQGVSVALEVREVPAAGRAGILLGEPAGLSIGKVRLQSGETVLGVIAEPALVTGQKDISAYGGWRAYMADASGIVNA